MADTKRLWWITAAAVVGLMSPSQSLAAKLIAVAISIPNRDLYRTTTPTVDTVTHLRLADGSHSNGNYYNSLNRCHTSQVSVSFRPGEPGAGQRYATLVLTNHSKTCSVYGYVGMQLLNAQRLPLPTNVVRNRTQPPRRVVLSPGQSAFSTLHWTAVNGPGEPSNGQCEPTPSYIKVTPPNEMDFLLTRWDGGYVCLHGRIDTGPLVPSVTAAP
jgi:hypothetical protein